MECKKDIKSKSLSKWIMMHEPDYLRPITLNPMVVGGILPPDPTTGYTCIIGKTLLAYPEGLPREEYKVSTKWYPTTEFYRQQQPLMYYRTNSYV